MTKQIDGLGESLSALMDGEANELDLQRVLKNIEGEKREEILARWSRYHSGSEAMRGELPTIRMDMAALITSAVENEKTHRQALSGGFLDILGQFAVAASVAMLAIVGVQNYNQLDPQQSMHSAALDAYDVQLNTGPAMQFPSGFKPVINAQKVSVGALQRSQLVPSRDVEKVGAREFPEQEIRGHIDKMMSKHNDHTAVHSAYGVLPFIDINKEDVTPDRR